MNTLEGMLARRARHKIDADWHARAKASAEEADQHHRPVDSNDTARYRARQEATKAAATKNRSRWSDEDLAIALDGSLSSRAAAFQLGRTLYAVRTIRKKHGLR